MDPTPPDGKAAGDDIDAWYAQAYRELRRMARARLASGGRNTVLDTTALVHESYLRLAQGAGAKSFEDRLHFMAYAARVMRSVIIDLVRERQTERRGGEFHHVALTTHLGENLSGDAGEREITRVHEALVELEKLDERMARVVEMRYFAGMSEVEIASVLAVSERTVRREWQQAKLFLSAALR